MQVLYLKKLIFIFVCRLCGRPESTWPEIGKMYRDKWICLAVLVIVICLSVWHVSEFEIPSETLPFILSTENTIYKYPTQDLPTNDTHQLIDLNNFSFEIMNTPCLGSNPLLLVLVHSAPKNYKKRKTIRETWGQEREGMKLLFLLGSVNDSAMQEDLLTENNQYGDFVQGSFDDSYRNMTYKHVMAFKYAVYHCPQAKYILKTDDDIFVNTPLMMEFLKHIMSPFGARHLLLCNIIQKAKVLRSYRSKWRVGKCIYKNIDMFKVVDIYSGTPQQDTCGNSVYSIRLLEDLKTVRLLKEFSCGNCL